VNRRANGDRYVANQTIAPIAGEDGTITHFVAIQTDITERREHELALERSQDLSARTESAADVGGWELDLEREELRWTAGTRRIHGVDQSYDPTLEEAVSFYHPSDRETIRTAVERALEWRLPYDLEARLVTAAGETRLVRVTGQSIDDEDDPVLRGTIQDVTEQWARHQQLMVFNRVLRHNLRNGLNVVLGHAEQVEQTLSSAEPSSDAIERACADANQIISAAEDLYDVSERARELDSVLQDVRDVEPVEVRPLLEEVAAEYRDDRPEATIAVEGATPIMLANRRALRVVLRELVDNAIEHAGTEAPQVTIAARADSSGPLRVVVADSGEGMPEMEREVITVGEERPLKHGSGLGLWIVKWLVTAIGGTLEIEDNDPSGTVVSIVFPASRWQAPPDT
jgi:signal transduction histidine kinase